MPRKGLKLKEPEDASLTSRPQCVDLRINHKGQAKGALAKRHKKRVYVLISSERLLTGFIQVNGRKFHPYLRKRKRPLTKKEAEATGKEDEHPQARSQKGFNHEPRLNTSIDLSQVK